MSDEMIIDLYSDRKQGLPFLEKSLSYNTLVKKRHLAEDEGKSDFYYFNDQEILAYYLLHQTNLDKEKGKADRTITAYKQELMTFISHLIEYQESIGIQFKEINDGSLFKSLRSSHMEKYQNWLSEKYPYIIGRNSSYSPATIARKNAIIKHFLRFLYQVGYIENDVTRFMKATTVDRDERPNRDLGVYEVMDLLDFFSETVDQPVIFGIIHLLVTTGMRNEELCKAKVGDIEYDRDRESYYLHITGKGNKKRIVPLHDKVVQSVNRLRSARGMPTIDKAEPDMPLVVTSTGKAYSPSYLSQYFSSVMKRVHLPSLEGKTVTPHSFRHAFAILSYREGVDVYTVMRSLGHEKIETTEIYLPKEMEKDEHAALRWKNTAISKYL
ncbi:tyrosine-type recombinase/integrase [Gracilibacillus sp. YIM 98692]|uniref:tyrosine-type recombinase/integrase n=1 Tax=Gracilibacillus sp. YIM 98692 TaxID=2663532 RepID=UPI0013D1D916|nr:tyrosine-type recombinase/integrase [Gracilibacillus sp. YIM 98692]